MNWTLSAYDRAAFAMLEREIDRDDNINRMAEELSRLDDMELVQKFIDTMGDTAWHGERESLIDTAMEQLTELSCPEWNLEHDRMMAMPDERLIPACKRLLSVVRTIYSSHVVTDWAIWRDEFIDKMSEKALDDEVRACREDQYC